MSAKFLASTSLMVYDECNDHGGSTGPGNEEVHGDCGYNILRVRGSWNMHWLMTCSSIKCAS